MSWPVLCNKKAEFRTLWRRALVQCKSLLVVWVSLLSFSVVSFEVFSRVMDLRMWSLWSQWYVTFTCVPWVLRESSQHFYNGFKQLGIFLPLGTQLAAWNQEPIPWGGGVACTWKCWDYCDSLQGMCLFFLKQNLYYFLNNMWKKSVWKCQIIVTRSNLAGFMSLTAQPYVLSSNQAERDGLFPAKADLCSLVNTLKYPLSWLCEALAQSPAHVWLCT